MGLLIISHSLHFEKRFKKWFWLNKSYWRHHETYSDIHSRSLKTQDYTLRLVKFRNYGLSSSKNKFWIHESSSVRRDDLSNNAWYFPNISILSGRKTFWKCKQKAKLIEILTKCWDGRRFWRIHYCGLRWSWFKSLDFWYFLRVVSQFSTSLTCT